MFDYYFSSLNNAGVIPSALCLYLFIYFCNLYIICFFLIRASIFTSNMQQLVVYSCNNKKLSLMLIATGLSLAGVPPFSGFFTKFLICFVVLKSYGLVFSFCIYFIIFVSFFFYLRFVLVLRKNTRLSKTDLRSFTTQNSLHYKRFSTSATVFFVFSIFLNFFFFFFFRDFIVLFWV